MNCDDSDWALELQGLGVCRDGQWILRDIDWRVPAGACAAILGPNGSGKSTLARVIAGHLFPTVGDCTVLGRIFGQTDLAALRRQIRLVQSAGPCDVDGDLTALEVALTGFFGTLALYDVPSPLQRAAAGKTLEMLALGGVADHAYRTLSSGERVRALLARALVTQPDILLLDEPTAGLDLLAREQTLATIQALPTTGDPAGWCPTVILITHHLEELPPRTAQVLLLAAGRVVAGGRPDEVLREAELSRCFGCPVEVTRQGGRYYPHVHPRAWAGLLRAGNAGDT